MPAAFHRQLVSHGYHAALVCCVRQRRGGGRAALQALKTISSSPFIWRATFRYYA
jgi:hypothetical protein